MNGIFIVFGRLGNFGCPLGFPFAFFKLLCMLVKCCFVPCAELSSNRRLCAEHSLYLTAFIGFIGNLIDCNNTPLVGFIQPLKPLPQRRKLIHITQNS